MNYIYDIALNLNKNLYNFYEWNDDDNIDFYLKIPIFKVEKEVISDFINTSFIVEKSVLNRISGKVEIYNKKNDVKVNTCLFSDGDIVLGVMFDEHGLSIKKSYISPDEESDILDYVKSIKYTLINYKIKEKYSIDFFSTRLELSKKNEIKKFIKNSYNKREFMKLKYIFYEVYNEKNENVDKIYSKLINVINNNSKRDKMIEVIKSI